jgi:hypothetical protein
MFAGACVATFAHSFMFVVWIYAADMKAAARQHFLELGKRVFRPFCSTHIQALREKGCNQWFPINGPELEKPIVNALYTLAKFCFAFIIGPLMFVVIMVFWGLLLTFVLLSLVLAGVSLQMTRLLVVHKVVTHYNRLWGRPQVDDSDCPIDGKRWNHLVCCEAFGESLPCLLLNIINIVLLKSSGAKGYVSYVSVASLVFSAYMATRLSYRYIYNVVIRKMSIADVPTYFAHKKDAAQAGGEVAAAGAEAAGGEAGGEVAKDVPAVVVGALAV